MLLLLLLSVQLLLGKSILAKCIAIGSHNKKLNPLTAHSGMSAIKTTIGQVAGKQILLGIERCRRFVGEFIFSNVVAIFS